MRNRRKAWLWTSAGKLLIFIACLYVITADFSSVTAAGETFTASCVFNGESYDLQYTVLAGDLTVEVSDVVNYPSGWQGDISVEDTVDYAGKSYTITGVDFSGGSSGAGDITSISCNYNGNITSIDVSNCINLRYLYCSDTGITSLNVSGNPDLYYLYCSYTGITSLDVSGNPDLYYLDCTSTGITSLDVSGNPALNYLECSDTGITSLDVSGNPALTYLECSDTGITSLDVSGNPALTYLNCSYTGITSLDVTGNPALHSLDCSATDISILDLSQFGYISSLMVRDMTSLITLTTPGGHTVSIDNAGSEKGAISDYDFYSDTIYLWAEDTADQPFQMWTSDNTAIVIGNATTKDSASFTVTDDVTITPVFRNAAPTPTPTPGPTAPTTTPIPAAPTPTPDSNAPTPIPSAPANAIPKTGEGQSVVLSWITLASLGNVLVGVTILGKKRFDLKKESNDDIDR